MLENKIVEDLILRYNSPVPRYTSYPTALEFGALEDSALAKSYGALDTAKPLSVYIHLPFCANQCLYCGCNVLLSRRIDVVDSYLPLLLDEIRLKTQLLHNGEGGKPLVSQIHFGGGTPNFLHLSHWDLLFEGLHRYFDFTTDAEMSVELDPAVLTEGYLPHLRKLGFNRVSYGVQDVTSKVLEAVNRPQNIDHIKDVVVESRREGFSSVNIDLIYGLPHQTLESYQSNLAFIQELMPDRIALFSYAHVPWLKHHQRRLDASALTTPTEKLRIYLSARERFEKMGYEQIGMDHFGLPGDSLTEAYRNKTLHRNFMGYTTQKTLDMLAFGTSAIGFVSGVYMQNHIKMSGYRNAIQNQNAWFEKGFAMSTEDALRHEIITQLMSNFQIRFKEIEEQYGIHFTEHFAREMTDLEHYVEEGHAEMDSTHFETTETGSFIIRHIASVFDAYRKGSEQKGFSKAI